MSQRFHPYSQKQQKQTVIDSKSNKKPSNVDTQLKMKTMNKNTTSIPNYDIRSYLDESSPHTSKSNNLYPTLIQPSTKQDTKPKSILTNRTNRQANVTNSKVTDSMMYLEKIKTENSD